MFYRENDELNFTDTLTYAINTRNLMRNVEIQGKAQNRGPEHLKYV